MPPPQRKPDGPAVAAARAAVAAVYAAVPTMRCKGLCARDACTSVAMTPLERRTIHRETGVLLPEAGAFALTGDLCPALDAAERCRVYEHRPVVCRLWGTVRSMRCPHGCQPDGGFLPEPAGRELVAQVMEASGLHAQAAGMRTVQDRP